MALNLSTADKVSAIVFGLLGTSMFVGGFQMDRLEIRQIHPASIPGLVPMILGAALVLCAALLYNEARKTPSTNVEGDLHHGSWKDLGMCALLSCIYAVILVGWLPFYLATALYISTFILYFSRDKILSPSTRTRTFITAIIIGLVTAIAISTLFRYAFLVRLP